MRVLRMFYQHALLMKLQRTCYSESSPMRCSPVLCAHFTSGMAALRACIRHQLRITRWPVSVPCTSRVSFASRRCTVPRHTESSLSSTPGARSFPTRQLLSVPAASVMAGASAEHTNRSRGAMHANAVRSF